MRDKIIRELNELLEIDHDSVSAVMCAEVILPHGSDMAPHPASSGKQGARMLSAINVISHCLDELPIRPVFENGVIQRFE